MKISILPVYLFKAGAKINVQTSDEDYSVTPLHEAVSKRNPKLVALLASSSLLNVNIKDKGGHTPLFLAVNNSPMKANMK